MSSTSSGGWAASLHPCHAGVSLPLALGSRSRVCRSGLAAGAHPPAAAVGRGREEWRRGRQVGRRGQGRGQGLGQPREQGQGGSLRLGGGQAGRRGGPVGGQRVADAEALLLVGLEHVGEAEALAAHVAGVGLLARVGAPVPLHVGPAGEALAADLADVRLLPWGRAASSGVSLAGATPQPGASLPRVRGSTVRLGSSHPEPLRTSLTQPGRRGEWPQASEG